MDDLDRAILRMLREDARTPVAQIAKAVGCANATCHYRITKLEENKYIDKYTVLLNREKTNFNEFCYFTVKLKNSNSENIDAFSAFVKDIDSVVMCDLVQGNECDFIIKIGFKNYSEYRKIHKYFNSHELCGDLGTITCISSVRYYRISIDQLV